MRAQLSRKHIMAANPPADAPPVAPPPAEAPPVAHMHPKLASLLHFCELTYWIPILEKEEPMLVRDFDLFRKHIDENTLREVLDIHDELHEEHERAEKLPPEKVDRLVKELYKTDSDGAKSKSAAAAPMPPPAGAAASLAEQPELDIPACDRWSWEQGDTEVKLILRGLPLTTKAKDVKLTSKALTLSLSVPCLSFAVTLSRSFLSSLAP